MRAVLSSLLGKPRLTLIIVSGRSAADIASRIGLPELIYAGNHGLEIQAPGLAFVEPTAAALTDRLQELTRRARELLAEIPGVIVEPKGLTTSVHFRNVAPEQWDRVAQIVSHVVATDDDFVLTSGHRIWEVRPRAPWHKGHAVHWVMRQLGDQGRWLVFFLGDDCTDEDAFASLPEGVTVRVGDPSPTNARYRLADPAEVERFLTWLSKRVGPAGTAFSNREPGA